MVSRLATSPSFQVPGAGRRLGRDCCACESRGWEAAWQKQVMANARLSGLGFGFFRLTGLEAVVQDWKSEGWDRSGNVQLPGGLIP